MSKKVVELVSKNAYAKYLGVNEKAIRNAVNEGKIKKGWDADRQKIIKHIADKEYGFLHQVPKAGPGVSKAKLADKISPIKKPDKVAKVRKNEGESSDENLEVRTSEEEGGDEAEKLDLTRLGADDLQKLLIHPDMSYKEALTASIIIEAATKKRKLEELDDTLVRRDIVEKALFAFGSNLKKALMAIPARVTDDMMSAANKVEAINVLNEELTRVLDQHSDINKLKLSNKN